MCIREVEHSRIHSSGIRQCDCKGNGVPGLTVEERKERVSWMHRER
jgi:hypothetical protein